MVVIYKAIGERAVLVFSGPEARRGEFVWKKDGPLAEKPSIFEWIGK